MNKVRSYSELSKIKTFEGRFEYLRLRGKVGTETFGFERRFNQIFYNSREWKNARNIVIVRDNGCDLGINDYAIPDGVPIYIHHMNPISLEDIENRSQFLFDPNFLITTSFTTHNSIHYGSDPIPLNIPIERHINDTCPWRIGGINESKHFNFD